MKRLVGLIVTLIFLGGTLAPAFAHSGKKTREYWIAADEVRWDYATSFTSGGNNPMIGVPYTAEQKVFVADFIGSTYIKSVYREYSEGFAALKPRSAHFGCSAR